jgi:hypothetical protein
LRPASSVEPQPDAWYSCSRRSAVAPSSGIGNPTRHTGARSHDPPARAEYGCSRDTGGRPAQARARPAVGRGVAVACGVGVGSAGDRAGGASCRGSQTSNANSRPIAPQPTRMTPTTAGLTPAREPSVARARTAPTHMRKTLTRRLTCNCPPQRNPQPRLHGRSTRTPYGRQVCTACGEPGCLARARRWPSSGRSGSEPRRTSRPLMRSSANEGIRCIADRVERE